MGHADLTSYFRQATAEMQMEYERLRSRALQDPGTAGDEGEGNWVSLFKRWLPGDLHIASKGRVLCANGVVTDQVDIVVLSPMYPHALREKKMHLASEVLAIFECKTTLRRSHIEEAVQKGSAAKQAIYNAHGKEVIYGLVAHSHSWRSEKEKVAEGISKELSDASLGYVRHPNDNLDVVCVADLGTWVGYAYSDEEAWGPGVVTEFPGPSFGEKRFAFSQTEVPPIGRALTFLLVKLSRIDKRYGGLAIYFLMSNLAGVGASSTRNTRHWSWGELVDQRRDVRLFPL